MSKKYNAFISYSHQDSKWGEWLHKNIEKFTIPKEYRARVNEQKNLYPVFRDRTELPSSSSLNNLIIDALQNSSAMIVICSPNSAKSPWVNEEIRRFKVLHGEKRVFPLIIDGEPNATSNEKLDNDLECFPKALRYEIGNNGELDKIKPTEPIAADAREIGDGEDAALIKTIAGILEIGFDDLWKREIRRQREEKRRIYIIAIGFALVALVAIYFWFNAEKQKNIAQTNEKKAQKERLIALQNAAKQLTLISNIRRNSGNSVDAALIALEAYDLIQTETNSSLKNNQYLPQIEFSLDQSLRSLKEKDVILSVKTKLNNVLFLSDEKKVVVASDEGLIYLVDSISSKVIMTLDTDMSDVLTLQISKDDKYLLAIDSNGKTLLWNLTNGHLIKELHKSKFGTLRNGKFSYDGSKIATLSRYGELVLWNVENGKKIAEYHLRTRVRQSFRSIDFSPNDSYLLTTADDQTAALWSVDTGTLITEMQTGSKNKLIMAYNPYLAEVIAKFTSDGTKIITGSSEGIIKVWTNKGEFVFTVKGHDGRIVSIDISKNNKYFVTSSTDKTAKIWEIKSAHPISTLTGHTASVTSVQFLPNSNLVMTTSNDDTTRVWNMKDGKEIVKFYINTPNPSQTNKPRLYASYSLVQKKIVTSFIDGTLRIWKLPLAKNAPLILQLTNSNLSSTIFGTISHNGQLIASANYGTPLKIWDINTGLQINNDDNNSIVYGDIFFNRTDDTIYFKSFSSEMLHFFELNSSKVKQIKFKFDTQFWNKYSISCKENIMTTDGGQIIDLKKGRLLHQNEIRYFNYDKTSYYNITSTAISCNNTFIVTTAVDNTARIWDINGSLRYVLAGHNDYITGVSISPNNKYIATGSRDGTVRVWDVASGKLISRLNEHKDHIVDVKFSSNSKHLAASSKHQIRIWDINTSVEISRLNNNSANIIKIEFAKNGTIIFAITENGKGIIWRLSDNIENLVKQVKNKIHRCFTPKERKLLNFSPKIPEWCKFKWPYNNSKYMLAEAHSLLSAGIYDEAHKLYTEMHKEDKNLTDTIVGDYANFAWELFKVGDMNNAKLLSSLALGMSPKQPLLKAAILNTRGQVYLKEKKYLQSLYLFDKAIELGDDYIITWMGRAQSKEKLKNYIGAIQDYKQVLNLAIKEKGDEKLKKEARIRINILTKKKNIQK